MAVKLSALAWVLLGAHPLVGLPLTLGLFAQGLLARGFLLPGFNPLLLGLQVLLLGVMKFQSLRVLLLL